MTFYLQKLTLEIFIDVGCTSSRSGSVELILLCRFKVNDKNDYVNFSGYVTEYEPPTCSDQGLEGASAIPLTDDMQQGSEWPRI